MRYKNIGQNCILLFSILFLVNHANGQSYPDVFLNGEIKTIQSTILDQERKVFIYLPNDYHNTVETYPVHYITDAPGTSNLYHDLLRLHAMNGPMPSSIVVGLWSDNREHNLHVEKGGPLYMDYLTKEVIPFIESNYRVNSFRAISGHSLGGGFAIYAFLTKPDLFNLCIAGSPYPLLWLTELQNSSELPTMPEDRFLYTTIGSDEDITPDELEAFASSKLFTDSLATLFHAVNQNENHISNIAVNFQNGLEWFYSDWKFAPQNNSTQPVAEQLKEHYQQLSHKVGYEVLPDEWQVVFPVMDQLAQKQNFDGAIAVLKYCISIYPQSDQAHAFLARAYLSTGQKELAREYIDKALALNPQNGFARQMQNMLK